MSPVADKTQALLNYYQQNNITKKDGPYQKQGAGLEKSKSGAHIIEPKIPI